MTMENIVLLATQANKLKISLVFLALGRNRQDGVTGLKQLVLLLWYILSTDLFEDNHRARLYIISISWLKREIKSFLEVVATFKIFRGILISSSQNTKIDKVKNDITKVSAFFNIPMIH